MHNVLNPAIETLSRDELGALQLRRLLHQLSRSARDVPFYRKAWGDDIAKVRTFADFRQAIPYTSKSDFLADLPERDGRLADGSDIFQYHMTSGTSGLGQETHPISIADHEALATGWQYQAHWAGLRAGDKMCFTWPIGLQTGGLSTPITAQRMGMVGIQLGPYSSDDKLRYMDRFQPQALVASPSYITHLAYLYEQQGRTPAEALPGLKALFVAGESYPLSWALKAMEAWGCVVSEWYGLMQGGMNQAFSCEAGVVMNGERGTLHGLDHRLLTEVLDPVSGEPVEPGEAGEIVLTTLSRDAFPIIRFRTGDKARVLPGQCPCGRQSLALESGTVARFDDMMKVRGQNIWPEAVDRVVLANERVAEYAGEVMLDDQGREQVRVRVEFKTTAETDDDQDEQRALLTSLKRQIKSTTNVTMVLEAAPPGSLPRFEFKARRWIDRRREGRDVIRYVARG